MLKQWIIELPKNKYRYFAETLPNNSRLYVERPGRLNKGCDFVIYIENLLLYKNGNDKPPKHQFLLADLQKKKNGFLATQWQSVISAIDVIHNIGTIDNAVQHTNNLPSGGVPMETILKMLRWFFVEQDLTYWAKCSRKMLYNEIKKL